MKKAIEKPFKVNHKIYVIMTVVSCMGIICGCYWINLNQCSNNIIDIIKNISMIDTSKRFIAGDTVIIFDELQEFPDIATALKSFRIDGRFDVICSGSLLGIN